MPCCRSRSPCRQRSRSLPPYGRLAIATPGHDLIIAACVDDSVEIRPMPYQAILRERFGHTFGSGMRRATRELAFFVVNRFEKPYSNSRG
jgi:hypothetical protein